jgi:hypothetical protein
LLIINWRLLLLKNLRLLLNESRRHLDDSRFVLRPLELVDEVRGGAERPVPAAAVLELACLLHHRAEREEARDWASGAVRDVVSVHDFVAIHQNEEGEGAKPEWVRENASCAANSAVELTGFVGAADVAEIAARQEEGLDERSDVGEASVALLMPILLSREHFFVCFVFVFVFGKIYKKRERKTRNN